MSKYPCQYESASKGPVDIESMATPHLMNAWRKWHPSPLAVGMVNCMAEELQARGGVYDPDTDRWEFPPKPEDGPGPASIEEAAKTVPIRRMTIEDAYAEADRKYHERKDEGLDPLTGREL